MAQQWTDEEWKKWKEAKEAWTDEEWKKWREAQAQAGSQSGAGSSTDKAVKNLTLKMQRVKEKDEFVKAELAKASAACGGLKFTMPDEWTVTVLSSAEKAQASSDPNLQRKPQSFADLQRLANGRLKSMWQCWQAETFALRSLQASGQTAAVTLVTAEKIDKNTVVKDLQTRLQKTEAELQKMKEKRDEDLEDMEDEKEKAEDQVKALQKELAACKADFERKLESILEEHDKKLASKDRTHKLDLAEKTAECQRLMADQTTAHEKKLAAEAKSFEGKIEVVTMKLEAKALAEAEARHAAATKHGQFRARVAHSMGKWRERCSNLEKRLNAKKAVLRSMKLEKELAKDRQVVGSTCCGKLSAMLG